MKSVELWMDQEQYATVTGREEKIGHNVEGIEAGDHQQIPGGSGPLARGKVEGRLRIRGFLFKEAKAGLQKPFCGGGGWTQVSHE